MAQAGPMNDHIVPDDMDSQQCFRVPYSLNIAAKVLPTMTNGRPYAKAYATRNLFIGLKTVFTFDRR